MALKWLNYKAEIQVLAWIQVPVQYLCKNKPKYLYIYKCSNALIPMIFVKIPVWTVNVDVQALLML